MPLWLLWTVVIFTLAGFVFAVAIAFDVLMHGGGDL